MRTEKSTRLAVFYGKQIRRTLHEGEWCFVIADVVAALTDLVEPKGYIKDMLRRNPELAKGWGQIATPLSVQTSGDRQKLNCANTEGLFCIIQSIPSPKVEPFYVASVKREIMNRTRMTRIYTGDRIRVDPRHPCNPCSIVYTAQLNWIESTNAIWFISKSGGYGG